MVADDGQRLFLQRILAEGADRLGYTLDGEPVFGWRDRTIGSAARSGETRVWVRATAEHERWAQGEAWTGNQDAAALTGLPKPDLLGRVEWAEPPVVIYAEAMSYIPDPPCSATPELREHLELPDSWWSSLRHGLDEMGPAPTRRRDGDPATYLAHVERMWGRSLALPPPEMRTEHADLHWANLTHPKLWILDWEYWGRAPTGYGAATLRYHSMLVPTSEARVHTEFADVLDTPTGQIAQLGAAAHILDRIHRMGDYPQLEDPILEHAHRLLARTEA